MLPGLNGRARRVLMTVDAVGGVWRYALDLAAGLQGEGTEVLLAGLGPAPSAAQRREAEATHVGLAWLDVPLDWMTDREAELDRLPALLGDLAARFGADLLQVNAPTQAAGLAPGCPLVVVSHSCVPTWFEAVRGGGLPAGWDWHRPRNRAGFDRADCVVAPSASHAALLETVYGPIPGLRVVANGSSSGAPEGAREAEKDPFVLAAARWWDEAKDGRTLDLAADAIVWPVVMAGATEGPNGAACPLAPGRGAGLLPAAEVDRLMARAAVFVSSSLYEPFGLAALEAAKTGAALVLSDIPTHRELWDGAALFFAPRDPSGLAAAANRLAEDDALRQRLGAAARERAERFTLAAQAAVMAEVYRSAMEMRMGRAA